MPYDVDDDPYTNIESGILENRLGITDQASLDEAEAEITSGKMLVIILEDRPNSEDLTWQYFCNLHKRVFEDIYDWAGTTRTVELSKGSTSFARAVHIQSNGEGIFRKLRVDNYFRNLTFDMFVTRLATLYSDLNVLHPFREGNGRVIRTFLSQLAENAGWEIDWESIDADYNVECCIKAYNGNEEPLRTMLSSMVTEHDVFWDEN